MRVYRGFYTKEDKEALSSLTDNKILLECVTRKMNLLKIDNKARIWTKEEYDILKANWGKLSKAEIAKMLNRSVAAVKCKSHRIGLREYFVYSEEITLNQLGHILFKRNIDSYTIGIWTRYKMPFKKVITCENDDMKVITIADFLEWLEQNKKVINLSNTEQGCFGVDEPDWLIEKRIADKKAAAYGPHNKVWTPEEDEKLKELVESQKYGYREISIILKRTEGALKRRMLDLKLEKRPPKAYNHNMWKDEEIQIVKDLWLKGYQSCIISEYLPNRSALAVNGILERHKYFGDPPLKYKL